MRAVLEEADHVHADAAGVPLSHTEYSDGKVTRYGPQMLSLLQATGV